MAALRLCERPVVLFDFDGTVADTGRAVMTSTRKTLAARGFSEAQMGDLRRMIGPPLWKSFHDFYGFSREESLVVADEYRAFFDELGPEEYPVFDGIPELLDGLAAQGHRMAVATSRMEAKCIDMVHELGLSQFEAVVGMNPSQGRETKADSVRDALAALGATAGDAFDVKRTMSDDGERLTKLNVEGALTIGGETWTVSGYLRQPGGRAPKDTFELTFRKDDKNVVELVYSALRQDKIEQKDRKGQTSVATTLKASGKLEGYSVYMTLKVNQRNDWTADGETLNEKITVSVNMTQKDNRPGKNMQGLNRIDAEGKNVIRVTTGEATADALDCELTGKLMLNENTFLQGGASMRVTIGGEAPDGAQTDGDAEPWTLEEAVRALSRRLYRQLDEQTKKNISDGL
mgnify:CR=1 FL=1